MTKRALQVVLASLAAALALGVAPARAQAVYGAIGDKYNELGGPQGVLGQAVTSEAPAPYGGRFNQFRNGFIYFHPQTGAHAVYGVIGEKWNQLGRVEYGYPTTDETATPDGRGRYNQFRAVQLAGAPEASIYWTPETGAHAVYGAIRQKWVDQGWEHGRLGFPKSDEYEDHGYRRVDFEHGFIRWSQGAGASIIMGFVTPAQCTREFRAWRNGNDMTEIEACQELMGINKYCADRDSVVMVAYAPQTEHRYLSCQPRYHSDSVGDQFEHIAKGVSEGLGDAFVAAAPFMGPTVEGLACVHGLAYACAVLALDIAEMAGVGDPLAGLGADAVALVGVVDKCADLDYVDCAVLGVQSVRHAAGGQTVPGQDPDAVAADVQLCGDGDFAACARLGKAAADAAGVPQGLGPGAVDAQACVDGDADACLTLGREASKAGAPLGGVYQGAYLADQCAKGDVEACRKLGKATMQAYNDPGRGVRLGHAKPPPQVDLTHMRATETGVRPAPAATPPATQPSPAQKARSTRARVTP